MKIVRRPSFTLLETLIAIAWTTMLLSTLTFFYRQIDSLNSQTEAIQKQSFKQRLIENRLSKVLTQAVSVKDAKEDFFFFTLSDVGGLFKQGSSKTLIFLYDNGIDLNKNTSNYVLGRLYLDENGRLCLATWPAPSRWGDQTHPPVRNEVLLEEVDSLDFFFFIPPEKKWNGLVDKDEKKESKPDNSSRPANNRQKQNASQGKASTKEEASQEAAQPNIAAPSVKPQPEGSWVADWNQDYRMLPGMVKLVLKRHGVEEIYVFPVPNTKRQIVYNL